MAQKITVEGKIDDKPLPPELKTKVQNALKSSLETELKTPGLIPSHHFSVTHYSVVYDKT